MEPGGYSARLAHFGLPYLCVLNIFLGKLSGAKVEPWSKKCWCGKPNQQNRKLKTEKRLTFP